MNETTIDKTENFERDAGGVTKNLSFLIWSGAVSVANSIVIWIFIARFRNAEEVAGFTVAMGLYALFFNVCSLGLSPFLVSEISRRRERGNADSIINLIGNAAIFLLSSGAVCAALMSASVFFLTDKAETRFAAVILSFALVPTGAIVLAEAAAIAHGRARLIASLTTLENVLRTIVPLMLLWFGGSIELICASFAAVRLIIFAAYLIIAKRHWTIFRFDRREISALCKVAPTFAGTIIFASINWQLPILLLARLSAENEAARYGVASRFLIPAAIFAASYANAIQPELTRRFAQSSGAAAAYLSRMAGYILILTVISAIASVFLSGAVLTFLFGAKYAAAARTLDILAVTVIPFSLTIIIARGLIAVNAQRVDLFANIFGAAICLTAGWLIVPHYGANGAAAAQLLAFSAMALIIVVYLSLKLTNFKLKRASAF